MMLTADLADLSASSSWGFLLAAPGASGPAVADQCEGCGVMMASLEAFWQNWGNGFVA